jgi:SAM-dependent methyltransferase
MSYSAKIEEEIRFYQDVTNVHDLPSIFHYWSSKYLQPKFELLGFSNPDEFYIRYISRIARSAPESNCKILSLGAGNCDAEVRLSQVLAEIGIHNFTFDCLDINAQMLARGRQLAQEARLTPHFAFVESDISGWETNDSYNIIIANQSLHHFVELEVLFEKARQTLRDDGFFLTNDMIGRNGHMRWPEALELVQALWSLLDEKHKWNCQLKRQEEVYENWDCSLEGFEGVRSQDILPLLLKTFQFDCFLGFANLASVFVDRNFGPNFNITSQQDCNFIDFVAKLDDYFIESGKIKPTQMLAAMTKSGTADAKVYKHLTPEFCVRDPKL